MFIEHNWHPLDRLHCPLHTGIFFGKLFQKTFGTCHNDNGDAGTTCDEDVAAATTADVAVADAFDANDEDDGDWIVAFNVSSDETLAAAAAASAFNNFISFLRAEDDAEPEGSTHIT